MLGKRREGRTVVQKMLGRYRILGELGRGAMGTVYRAVDLVLEREVALKTLLPDLPEDVVDEVRIRFLREARSAGRLSHPNIVTIFDVGQEGETAYIAMELLEGRSLHQMLKDPQRIPFHAAADIITQVAEALEHAHKFSIVHRDVKPANVVVSPSGRAKLTDFGVAYVPASNVTQTGSALGSPRYMAPEQVLGQPIDSRADLFSLGVVLYELLTKRTPFEWPGDTTVFALMQRIAGEPHPPLRQIDPQIPEGFERIMDRALAKRPQDRYQKAAEMASDLRNYHSLGGGTVFAKTVPLPVLPTAAAAAAEQKVRNQLIDDLDHFAKNFESQEKEHLRAEQEERLKKEQAWRNWGAAEEQKRESFERAAEGDGDARRRDARRPPVPDRIRQGDECARAACGQALRVHLSRQAAFGDADPGIGEQPHVQACGGQGALRADPLPLSRQGGRAAQGHAPGRGRRPLRAVPQIPARGVPGARQHRGQGAPDAVRGERPPALRDQHPGRLRGGDRHRRADQRAALRPRDGALPDGRLEGRDRRPGALRARRRQRLQQAAR